MEKQKQPYHSPQITRIVLNREQAILSQCRSGATRSRHGGFGHCRGGCRANTRTTRNSDSQAGAS